jgi:hypothetical protein
MQAERSRSFRVPLTTEELTMLHDLSEAEGVAAAALVRQYIRREHAARFGGTKAKGAKR